MSITDNQLAELISSLSQKEDKTQKFSQNNTYVSVGVLLMVLGGATFITNELSDMKQSIAEVRIEMRTFAEAIGKHEGNPYHAGFREYVDGNYVTEDNYSNLVEDVLELKNNLNIIQATQQQILLEIRSNK